MVTEFGKILRKLRIDRNETLKTMAEKLNITSSYLSAIERGKRAIPVSLPDRLTSIYRLDIREQNKLHKAYDESIDRVIIKLPPNNIYKRNLALVFAKEINNLSNKQVTQLLKMITSEHKN